MVSLRAIAKKSFLSIDPMMRVCPLGTELSKIGAVAADVVNLRGSVRVHRNDAAMVTVQPGRQFPERNSLEPDGVLIRP
jgi:hypothetical protein